MLWNSMACPCSKIRLSAPPANFTRLGAHSDDVARCVFRTPRPFDPVKESRTVATMVALLFFLLRLLVLPFRSISRLEAENAALQRQLIVLQRQVRGRVQFTNSDRLFFLQLYRWFPSIVKAMTTIRPETLVRWHRAGFRRYWRWKWEAGHPSMRVYGR
jgi:hypothetical protein